MKVVSRVRTDPSQFVTLDHVSLEGKDYSFRKIGKFAAIGSTLRRCSFKDAQIDDATFGAGQEMSEYVECIFDGIQIGHATGHARFIRCTFSSMQIREWMGQTTEFIDCTFGGRLRTAMFFGRIPIEELRRALGRERNEFRGNDFSNTQMTDVSFQGGINLEEQQLPSGPNYLYLANGPAAMGRLKAELEKWQAVPEAKKSALILAQILTKIVESGQKQLFLQPPGYYEMSEDASSRAAVDKVFGLLEEFGKTV